MRAKLAFNLVARLYNLSLGYGIIMLLTKNYSLEEYGKYAFLLSSIAILDRFNNWGLSKNLIYQHNKNIEKPNNSFLITITAITSAILGSALYLVFNPFKFTIYSLIIILFSFSTRSLMGSMFLVESKYRIFALITNIFQVTVLLLVVIYAIFINKIGIVEVFTISETIQILLCLFLGFKLKVLKMNLGLSKGSFKRLLKLYSSSWSYFLVDIVHMISVELDKIVVGLYFSPETLAPYSVAEKLARMSIVPLNNISSIIQGQVSKVKNNVNQIRELFFSYSTVAGLCSLPITFILVLFGIQILSFLGGEYKEAYSILLILLAARLGQYLTGFKAVILQMTKYRTLEVYNNVLKVVLILGGFLALVKFLGIYAIAASFLTGMVTISLIQVYQIRKKFRLIIVNSSYFVLLIYLCLTGYYFIYGWDWFSISLGSCVFLVNAFLLFKFSKKIKEY